MAVPYGRYAGQPVKNIPASYFVWLNSVNNLGLLAARLYFLALVTRRRDPQEASRHARVARWFRSLNVELAVQELGEEMVRKVMKGGKEMVRKLING